MYDISYMMYIILYIQGAPGSSPAAPTRKKARPPFEQ